MALTVPVAEIVENSKNPLLGKHESWERVLLGDIATIQNGFPFKSSQFTKDGGMPLIRIRDVGADNTDTNYVGDYEQAFVVEAGDFLIGMDGDFNCARWRGSKGLLNQRVCRVTLKSDIYHPKLLDYVLPGYLKAINEMTSSVTVKHLSSKSIAEIPLPLPPKDQQKRIVAEIEKQFSRLDEAVAGLKRVKANLKRYKAAVLKAAVEGRLVETEADRARREGRSYETGEQLLQRILETRRSQWQGKGKYKEPAAPDTTDLPELPEGWVWATTSQVLREVKDGTHDTPKYHDTGIPFITQKHVKAAGFVFDDFSRISLEDHENFYRRSNPERADILVSMIGVNRGESCIVDTDEVFSIKNVGLLKPDHKTSSVKFIKYFLSSALGQRLLLRGSKGGAQPFVGLAELRKWPLTVPPLAEQHRIVAEVDRHLSLLHKMESQVGASLLRAANLRQSILSRAFSSSPLATNSECFDVN
ncbi:MAG TPA: restriction endonuclease subunit S [Parasulfuritortus sp.]